MPCAASITALRPEPHTLLIVSAPTPSARPPLSAACRAGAWPTPALTTLPMMHSSTAAGSMPARRTASRTTSAPRSVALKSFSAPRNLPVGVRTALTMTDSRMGNRSDSSSITMASDDVRRRAAVAAARAMHGPRAAQLAAPRGGRARARAACRRPSTRAARRAPSAGPAAIRQANDDFRRRVVG